MAAMSAMAVMVVMRVCVDRVVVSGCVAVVLRVRVVTHHRAVGHHVAACGYLVMTVGWMPVVLVPRHGALQFRSVPMDAHKARYRLVSARRNVVSTLALFVHIQQ